MRITSKGQVTIPKDVRKAAGLLPDTEVDFVLRQGRVFLRKRSRENRRGAKLVAALRGRGTVKMTTEEIMALTRGE